MLEILLAGFALSPLGFCAMAMLGSQQLLAITLRLLVWSGVARSVKGLPAGVEIKTLRICGKIPLLFCSQFQFGLKSKFAFIIRLVNQLISSLHSQNKNCFHQKLDLVSYHELTTSSSFSELSVGNSSPLSYSIHRI